MTGRVGKRKGLHGAGWFLGLAVAVAPNLASAGMPFGEALELSLSTRPIVLDYELPGHPSAVGVGHVGVTTDACLHWRYDPRVTVELGIRARLPFSLDPGPQAGAFPLFALVLRPFGELAVLRFGSLDLRHGHHPAVLDEDRYRYGRPIEDTYNSSLVPEAHRRFGEDLYMPAENGAQFILQHAGVRAEVYLDWQLLETIEHREKFAVGVLLGYEHRWVEASLQYRLVHYGGQRFTQREEIRRLGLDPKRQPTTLAVTVRPKPLRLSWLEVALPVAFLNGRVVQTPGEAEARHFGFEAGIDVTLFDMVRLGYRAWLPDQNLARRVSEDGDPIYEGPRSHRAIIGLTQTVGPAVLAGRLDLVFADGSDKVQYLAVTTVELAWRTLLMSDSPLP